MLSFKISGTTAIGDDKILSIARPMTTEHYKNIQNCLSSEILC